MIHIPFKPTVLIVDDILNNIELLANILETEEYEILTALSGKNALQIIENNSIDLVLLDINMPEMDGFTVCENIKQKDQNKEIPIIFITALNDTNNKIKGLEMGGVDYITKPFIQEELLARVKIHIDLRRSKFQLHQELEERKKIQLELENYKNHLEELVEQRTVKLELSEQKFRNIFNSIHDAIFITDFDGITFETNEIVFKKNNITREKFIGYEMIHLFPAENQKKLRKYIKELQFKGPQIIEISYFTRTGQNLFFEVSGKIIQYEGKEALLHIVRDITERKMLERKIVKTIIETEEKERNRFAKDLHDGLDALLSGIKMYLNLILSGKLDKNQRENIINQTRELVNEAVSNTREIANNIKPHELSRFGLGASIQSFCEKFNETSLVNIRFDFSEYKLKANDDMDLILFRVVNEFINNSVKHSSAKNISILLKNTDRKIHLFYKDDGIGFDFEQIIKDKKNGMGLQNIFTRINSIGGKCELNSSPGNGMNAEIEIYVE
jgi:PAS domain S-box-containing protein